MKRCGYPEWAFEKVKSDQQRKGMKNKEKKEKQDQEKVMNMVVLPYISGFTEKLDRIFRKHKITTAVRPHQTLRQ